MSRNSGSIATWVGITSAARSRPKRRSRPAKRSLVKAYPAIALSSSDSAVTAAAIRVLLRR